MAELACPHCGHTNEVDDGSAAGVVDCESCRRSFAVFGHFRSPGKPTPTHTGGLTAADDTSLLRSGAVAIAAEVVLYATLETPLGNTYFGQLLSARGWVPYAIALFSLWAFAMLAFKLQQHRRQSGVLRLELLPRSLGERIDASSAEAFRTYLGQLATLEPGNPLIVRLDWAMRRMTAHNEPSELVSQLGDRSRLDADVLDSSYAMLRVLVWAIPILGFIGTVLGISEAVSGFSNSVHSAANLEVMRASIGSVTTGLGVAFDTTLLALMMSILIMFPMSALQRAEEGFLTRCDNYCDAHLLSRLAATTDQSTVAAASTERDLRSMIDELEARIARLEPARPER